MYSNSRVGIIGGLVYSDSLLTYGIIILGGVLLTLLDYKVVFCFIDSASALLLVLDSLCYISLSNTSPLLLVLPLVDDLLLFFFINATF
jgi:hypothetical protein